MAVGFKSGTEAGNGEGTGVKLCNEGLGCAGEGDGSGKVSVLFVIGVGGMGTCAGSGNGVERVRVEGGMDGKGIEGRGLVDVVMVPFSRLTRFGGATLPSKNSRAERAGSDEGAGGKMSDWKESAYIRSI